MSRALIGIGIFLVILGVAWPWVRLIPLGRLPGDITIHRQGVHLYLPLTSCVLVSLLASLLLWLFRK